MLFQTVSPHRYSVYPAVLLLCDARTCMWSSILYNFGPFINNFQFPISTRLVTAFISPQGYRLCSLSSHCNLVWTISWRQYLYCATSILCLLIENVLRPLNILRGSFLVARISYICFSHSLYYVRFIATTQRRDLTWFSTLSAYYFVFVRRFPFSTLHIFLDMTKMKALTLEGMYSVLNTIHIGSLILCHRFIVRDDDISSSPTKKSKTSTQRSRASKLCVFCCFIICTISLIHPQHTRRSVCWDLHP